MFDQKIMVIKYGGSAMTDDYLKKSVIEDVISLKQRGMKPIIVHGGGKEISRWMARVGKKPEFVNGLRVTDEETMEIAEMVLGRINKELVLLAESMGVKAIGISGKDGAFLKVKKKYIDGKDMGYVGSITEVQPQILMELLRNDYLPIVAPVGFDEYFHTYNINADDAACAIAKAVKAERLAFLTDIEGVYKNPEDPKSVVSKLFIEDAEELIKRGTVGGGMIPKLQNCMDAVEKGVLQVHILDGRVRRSLLGEFFGKRMGTTILKREGRTDYGMGQ